MDGPNVSAHRSRQSVGVLVHPRQLRTLYTMTHALRFTAVAAMFITATNAHAVTDTSGDFLASFTGAHSGALDILSAVVPFDPTATPSCCTRRPQIKLPIWAAPPMCSGSIAAARRTHPSAGRGPVQAMRRRENVRRPLGPSIVEFVVDDCSTWRACIPSHGNLRALPKGTGWPLGLPA